jgi:hypothetical protein
MMLNIRTVAGNSVRTNYPLAGVTYVPATPIGAPPGFFNFLDFQTVFILPPSQMTFLPFFSPFTLHPSSRMASRAGFFFQYIQ